MTFAINRIELDSVDSTNSYAKDLAMREAAEGKLVFAHTQTAGRGRQGNNWLSYTGNLYASLILRPRVTAADIGQLSFVIAVALAEVISGCLPQTATVGLKWPNDILLNNRKCAGILLESEGLDHTGHLPWVVAGFGVNLVAAPDMATCLTDEGANPLTPAAFLDRAEPKLSYYYRVWQNEGFAPIQALWSERAINRGGPINVRLARETLTGVFEGIDKQGALQLRMDDGHLRHISSGEVYL